MEGKRAGRTKEANISELGKSVQSEITGMEAKGRGKNTKGRDISLSGHDIGMYWRTTHTTALLTNYGINSKKVSSLASRDFVAFMGLENDNVEIIFIEVKSGKSKNLTPRKESTKKLSKRKGSRG